jgi:hypothetical protein
VNPKYPVVHNQQRLNNQKANRGVDMWYTLVFSLVDLSHPSHISMPPPPLINIIIIISHHEMKAATTCYSV